MPELPEVQTVADQLAPKARGRRVRKFELFDPKLAAMIPDPGILAGRRIADVRRIGKQVVILFDENHGRRRPCHALAVHLRMTGRLIFIQRQNAKPQNAKLTTHNSQLTTRLRARLLLDQGAIVFQDVRRFGTMRLADCPADLAQAGLDPLGPECTPQALAALLAGSRQQLKPWLLRQDRLVGLGNIYASEILFTARLSPFRPAGSLTPPEIRALHQATVKILRWGIAHGGTTFSDFQDANGERGRFREKLKVYGREGRPCGRCGAPVIRTVQQTRSTFHCPACQE